jgi:hypothetical protein
LRSKYPNGLSVGLEDRRQVLDNTLYILTKRYRTEKYVPPPPPPYIAFSGQGVSLGGASQPEPLTQVDPATVEKPKVIGEINTHELNSCFQVDPSKPKTNIQIRLYTGKVLRIEVNLNTKVSTLYDYVFK